MNNCIGEVQHWRAFRRHCAMKTAPVLEVERGFRAACGPPARRLPHAGGSATCKVCLAILGAGLMVALTAASASESSVAPAVAPVVQSPHPYPVMDPVKTLAGSDLTRALRDGGLVLYLRHTETGAVITEECNVSNLSARGEQEANRVGQALRTMKMSIGKILSSDVCRVRDTARLLDIGNFDIDEDLSNVPKRSGHDVHAARMRLLATPPPTGTNILLVSHMHAGNRVEQSIYLDFGEVIVFRPDRKGGSDAVARIRPQDWEDLRKTAEGR